MIRTLFSAAVFAAFFIPGLSPAAHAQDVTLTSRDGAITLTGTLRSFDGEFYRVDTAFGLLVLDGQGVRCDGAGCPDLADYVAEFTFSGAPVMGEVLLPALVEAYAARRGLELRRVVQSDTRFRLDLLDEATAQPLARIGFRLNSTAEGFADLIAEEADLVMALREVRDDEAALAKEAGLGGLRDYARVVALDALVPVVARGNPVTTLAVPDLVAFLSGAQTEWPLQAAPVSLHLPDPSGGLAQALEDRLMSAHGAGLSRFAAPHRRDTDLVDAVAADPLALGMTRLSEIGNAVPVALRGGCGMALPLDRRTLKTGDYPFSAPLLLYGTSQRLPLFAREFLAYLTTPAAQLVIRRAGFVDQSREQIALDEQGLRLSNALKVAGGDLPLAEVQQMLLLLGDAVRLTPTFRFHEGAAELDVHSRANIADLARALESGVFDGRELVFVGFTDSDGPWEANKALGRDRAAAVRDAVLKVAYTADQSRVRLSVAGFGEALPMACDDAEWGGRVNRRVEVWLR